MSAGKGDKPRPVNGAAYRENYDAIFRKPEWPDVIGGGQWSVPSRRTTGVDFPSTSVTDLHVYLAREPYVFDGPPERKIPRREFMKTNTEGGE